MEENEKEGMVVMDMCRRSAPQGIIHLRLLSNLRWDDHKMAEKITLHPHQTRGDMFCFLNYNFLLSQYVSTVHEAFEGTNWDT